MILFQHKAPPHSQPSTLPHETEGRKKARLRALPAGSRPLILGQACLLSFLVRFIVLANNYLQIRGIRKTDEGTYRCEGRILARGEVNFKDIQVIVNGKETRPSAPSTAPPWLIHPFPQRTRPLPCLFVCLFVKTRLLGLPHLWGLPVQFWNVLHYPATPEICPVLPNKFFLILYCP